MLAVTLFVLEILSTNITITATKGENDINNTDENLKTKEGEIQQDNKIKLDERRKFLEKDAEAGPIVDDIVQLMYKKIFQHLSTSKLKENMDITEVSIKKDTLDILVEIFHYLSDEEIIKQLKITEKILDNEDCCDEKIKNLEERLFSMYFKEPQQGLVVGLLERVSNLFCLFNPPSLRNIGYMKESKNELTNDISKKEESKTDKAVEIIVSNQPAINQ